MTMPRYREDIHLNTKTCPVPECTVVIPKDKLMCRGHFELVPAELQLDLVVFSNFRSDTLGEVTYQSLGKRAIGAVSDVLCQNQKEVA